MACRLTWTPHRRWGLCAGPDTTYAFTLTDEGSTPSSLRSFQVLVTLAKRGPVESGVAMVSDLMVAEGVPPDEACYRSVLRACTAFHAPDTALALYDQMRARGTRPSIVACAAVRTLREKKGPWDA
jgi:pentatricopeptide repeat protein